MHVTACICMVRAVQRDGRCAAFWGIDRRMAELRSLRRALRWSSGLLGGSSEESWVTPGPSSDINHRQVYPREYAVHDAL